LFTAAWKKQKDVLAWLAMKVGEIMHWTYTNLLKFNDLDALKMLREVDKAKIIDVNSMQWEFEGVDIFSYISIDIV
jgi:hypothetical protein